MKRSESTLLFYYRGAWWPGILKLLPSVFLKKGFIVCMFKQLPPWVRLQNPL